MPPENTQRAIETARPLIEGALTEEGCLDYDWCPNPLVPGRIRVFERWASEEALAAHFKTDWYLKMREHIGELRLDRGRDGEVPGRRSRRRSTTRR